MQILIDDNFAGFTEEKLLRDIALLPDWRREQAMRFKHLEGRRNCTRALLLLAECLGVNAADIPPFQYNEHDKPSLNSKLSTLNFNLSHCHEAVACMVSDVPCGIDVESVGRYSDSVARYSMDGEQMQQILRYVTAISRIIASEVCVPIYASAPKAPNSINTTVRGCTFGCSRCYVSISL